MSINTNIASTLTGGKKLQVATEVGGAVEVAVGDGFHDVVVEDVGGAFEVGDGAGDFTLCLLATGLAGTRWRG